MGGNGADAGRGGRRALCRAWLAGGLLAGLTAGAYAITVPPAGYGVCKSIWEPRDDG